MNRFAVIVSLLALASCSKTSPVAPTPTPTPTPTPAPTTYTVSGTVTATGTGAVLAGVTVAAGAVSSVTDAAGRYALTLPLSALTPLLSIQGPMLTHTGTLRASGTRTVDLDTFGAGFDATYFRAIAHDGFDDQGFLVPVRHPTTNPTFYVRTVDQAGKAIDPSVVQQLLNVLSAYTPKFSGGRYQAVATTGAADLPNAAGRVVVRWDTTLNDTECGFTGSFEEAYAIYFSYDRRGCSCGSSKVAPRTMKHELGHVMGLHHTGVPTDVMHGLILSCDLEPSAKELAYADLLNRRPNGNTDPDTDPASAPW